MTDAPPRPVRKVVIVGRDEALWLTAAVLQRTFARSDLSFTAVELPSLLRPGEVLPTLDSQASFHAQLGLEEEVLMRALGATFTLGQQYVGWAKNAPPVFVGYSSTGVAVQNVPFHHLWLRARASGLSVAYEDFAINAACAKHGRLLTREAELSGFAEAGRGYHLPAAPYGEMLRQVALKRGVRHLPAAHVSPVVQHAQMSAVVLSDGQTVEGDLFIDTTGSEARLLSQMPETGFTSWRHWLPFDRLLTSYAAPATPLPAFAQITAFRSGWTGLFPLRDYTALQQVYTTDELSDDEAFEAAAVVARVSLNPQATVTPFEAGQRRAWSGNVIGLGDAAAVLDPLGSARMPALLFGLSHLTALFPLDTDGLESAVYNRTVAQVYARLRDAQILLYSLNKRRDQPVWDRLRSQSLPPELAYRLELFSACGHMPMYDEETFDEAWWIAACLGHGRLPAAYDVRADQIAEPDLIRHFQSVLGYVRKQVETMPTPDAVSRAATV
ncbi:tryptophan 7-halogenase [Asticcacaulis sp.]|uniref:tryptophan 7-halogenase n=1 Tax=Asticcacaulis sp. TaxID=1872648 RepID=UPI0031E06380